MRSVSNLNAVMTELGYPWLADLTKFFKGIGDHLHDFQAWLHQHRDAEKTIGAVAAFLTATLAGIAAIGAVRMAGNLLGLGSTLKWLGTVFVWLNDVILARFGLGIIGAAGRVGNFWRGHQPHSPC